VYHLIKNDLCLFTFEDFFHALYCQAARAQDNDNVDNPEEAKESGGDEAVAEIGDGSEFNKASDESDIMVEVGNNLTLEVKGKCKASELVGVAKSHKNGIKRTKVTTSKPAVEVEVKAKPTVKAAAAKSPAKNKTPSKSPLKKK